MVFILAVNLYPALVLAQSSITLGANYLRTDPRGGFDYSVPNEGNSLRTTLVFEQQTSKRFGFYVNGTTGHKNMEYLYPRFGVCGDQNGLYICVFPGYWRQDQIFRFVETSVGGSVFFGRILRLRIGPYLAYNGIPTKQDYIHVDERFYYPARVQDMYGRFEFGGQAQLALVLPLGKHWFIEANGFLARSFSDLRKGKWADARAFLFWPEEASVEMTSERLINRYRSFGLSVGYTW